ncbi:5'/3'-nucleotidase SurE [Paraperlucidibaca wandonensis]|jgi:5'-nucleotidase|uniref:5'-nucleotidase SurE n=1 Tax=Paraperlucidibaca wandonensis TaxID=1268273 RepID=A0ABW3HBM0_9GAMM|tara:strand:- start:3520 stop:4281 length:762 start_codon:yes stop_codon:yes gene_type:complete
MRFLLSNDDGVLAPGLQAMADALANLGEVTVVAPDSERSAFSSALTLDRPLRPQRLANGFISLNGTPADCIHVALNGLLDFEPDLIVSGINAGPNLGDDVLYSGTVAAALEGRFLGHPAMAVSLAKPKMDIRGIDDYRAAAAYAAQLISKWQDIGLPPRSLLNINVPGGEPSEHKGFAVTRLGHRARSQDVLKLQDPRGNTVYWIGALGDPLDNAPGTDFYAVSEGCISVTPLDPDMTHRGAMSTLSAWIKQF